MANEITITREEFRTACGKILGVSDIGSGDYYDDPTLIALEKVLFGEPEDGNKIVSTGSYGDWLNEQED